MKRSSGVIIPGGISPFPSEREITAAQLLVSFFGADVQFAIRGLHKIIHKNGKAIELLR